MAGKEGKTIAKMELMNKRYECIIHWEKKREDLIPYSKTIRKYKREKNEEKKMYSIKLRSKTRENNYST